MSTRTTAKAQDAGPLVVCCARAEAQAIRSALSEMEDLGHTLELVEGVEADPKLLTPVIERLHGDGLYVLCRSKLLGRDTVEQLREILLTHHVPFARTVTVATQRPRDLVDRIKASVARSGTRRGMDPAGPAAEAPKAPAREPSSPSPAVRTAIPPLSRATLVATPAAIARSRAQSRPASARDLAFEDAITGAQPVVSPRVPIAADEGDEADEEFDPPTIELPELRERRALSQPTDPELAAISLTDAAIEVMDEEDVDPLHDIDNSLAGVSLATVDFSDLERADSGRIALHGLSVPVRTGNTSVAPAPAPPPREPSIPGPPIPSPAASRAVPSAPRTTTVEVPAVPQAAFTGSTMHVAPAAVSSPASTPMPSPGHTGPFAGLGSVSAPAGAAASASLEEEARPRGRGLVWAVALAGVAVVALAIAAVVMTGDDDDTIASADGGKKAGAGDPSADSAADSAADAAKEGAAPTRGDAADGSAPADDAALEKVADDAAGLDGGSEALAAVGSALADRKVRALDILLVQSASVGPMTHGDARTYCEALDLAGLQGWRLPEVGELYSLSEAGMVGPAVYWSHTAGDTFGDSHLAWHGKRKRVQHESGKSKVLCVHGERAAL